MIIPNARIMVYKQRTGVKGDGTPVLTTVTLLRKVPVSVDDPSTHLVQTLSAQDIAVDRIMTVQRAYLRGAGASELNPAVGDRITYQFDDVTGTGETETMEVRHIKAARRGTAAGAIETFALMLGRAEDGN